MMGEPPLCHHGTTMQVVPVPEGGIQPGTSDVALPEINRSAMQELRVAGVSTVVEPTRDGDPGESQDTGISDFYLQRDGEDGEADGMPASTIHVKDQTRSRSGREVQGLRARPQGHEDGEQPGHVAQDRAEPQQLRGSIGESEDADRPRGLRAVHEVEGHEGEAGAEESGPMTELIEIREPHQAERSQLEASHGSPQGC